MENITAKVDELFKHALGNKSFFDIGNSEKKCSLKLVRHAKDRRLLIESETLETKSKISH